MAVNNPLTITWRGTSVGGTSDSYQLNGPHVIEKSYERFLLVFEVVVVGTSYESLDTLSTALETAFSTRMAGVETLVIDIDGSTTTYTNGSTIFNAVPTITKTGNPDIDRGFSRAYTISIAGELPDDSGGGLREFQVLVDYDAARKRTVTMQGAYFATSGNDAVTQYLAQFPSVATNYLDFIDDSATWELIQESHTVDRNLTAGGLPNPHTCNFTRQYTEIIFEQDSGTLDDTDIQDHSVRFVEAFQAPGDSVEGVNRLRRVIGSFDCSIDNTSSTDMEGIVASKIEPYIKQLFETEYTPRVFAVEDSTAGYDKTGNRLSVQVQFVYQDPGDSRIAEVSQTVSYSESRFIDYTPVHGGGETDAYADPGYLVYERTWTRTVVAMGAVYPQRRLVARPGTDYIGPWTETTAGESGPDTRDGTRINETGWNIVASKSDVTPLWIGDPSKGPQMEGNQLSEIIVERFHSKPQAGTSTSGPTTGGPGAPGPTTGGPPPPAAPGPITPGGS